MFTKTLINVLNPMDYEFHPEAFPENYIDHFNHTPRKIRCISDGVAELNYLETSDDFGLGTHIWMCDVDDFTYYLRAIVARGLLKEGEEYELEDTYVEGDVRFGMVSLKGEPENEGIREGFHGFPAFLFEEMQTFSVEERQRNIDAYWKKNDDE